MLNVRCVLWWGVVVRGWVLLNVVLQRLMLLKELTS